MTPLIFNDNVVAAGLYGISGDGSVGMGLPSLTQWATVLQWNGNIIEKGSSGAWQYPTGTGNTILPYGSLLPLLNPTTFKLLNGTAGY
jgi:hypothetical protein